MLARKANYLADVCNHEVTVITTSQNNRPPFYPASQRVHTIDLGIDYEAIMSMPLIRRINARLNARRTHKERLSAALHDLRPDITVSMFTHEMSFLPSINDGSKKVLELHFSKNFRKLDAKSNNAPLVIRAVNAILDHADRRHINEYDKFVVLTGRDAADWGGKYRNITVIPNPSTFKPSQCERTGSHRALAVGRLCAQKGFDMLVESWSRLPESLRQEWALDIVGSGPDDSKLRHLIEAKGLGNSVSILPPTNEIRELYLDHGIFCFPSRYEGFGLSLMEAMSLGAAVVAFDCPCGPSEMISDGENGFLVPPDDIDGFSNRLQRLMTDTDLRDDMGKRAVETINNHFSEQVVMKKWDSLFAELKSSKQ